MTLAYPVRQPGIGCSARYRGGMGRGVGVLVAACGLVLTGCGWQPPSPPPLANQTCTEADGPSVAAVQDAIAGLPDVEGGGWQESSRGNSGDCSLAWVQVNTGAPASSAPEQVLFFSHDSFLGTPTPEPRPYSTVVANGADTASVQYQWAQGDEPDCCPTGVGSARFQLRDGKLTALDPIPGPS